MEVILKRPLNLEPLIAAAAADLGYACLTGHDQGDWKTDPGHFFSQWVMVARQAKYLDPLRAMAPAGYAQVARGNGDPYWAVPPSDRQYLWRDGAKNSLRGLVRHDPLAGSLGWAVTDVEAGLAQLVGYPQARQLAAPLRGMLDSLDRWRVERWNR